MFYDSEFKKNDRLTLESIKVAFNALKKKPFFQRKRWRDGWGWWGGGAENLKQAPHSSRSPVEAQFHAAGIVT